MSSTFVTVFAVFNVAFLYQLYQMYGRRTPEDVFDIMTKYSVSYIILEDSHCLAPSHNGCRLPDLIDVDNGIVCFYFTSCLQLPLCLGYHNGLTVIMITNIILACTWCLDVACWY